MPPWWPPAGRPSRHACRLLHAVSWSACCLLLHAVGGANRWWDPIAPPGRISSAQAIEHLRDRGATASCSGRGQRLFQRLLLLGGEVGADDGAPELGHLGQDALLVGVARHHKEPRSTWCDRA